MDEPPRTHHDLHMDGLGEVRVAVPADVAYDAIAGLDRMGSWSPENRGGAWLEGAGTVGAVFRSRNEASGGSWETTCTVIEAARPERFAWSVFPPGEVGTTWRFTFRAEGDGGTVVTETFEWDWTPEPDEGFRGRVGRMPLEIATAVVAGRQAELREAVGTTLANLKAGLEAS